MNGAAEASENSSSTIVGETARRLLMYYPHSTLKQGI
jgi:hypothetical protein